MGLFRYLELFEGGVFLVMENNSIKRGPGDRSTCWGSGCWLLLRQKREEGVSEWLIF